MPLFASIGETSNEKSEENLECDSVVPVAMMPTRKVCGDAITGLLWEMEQSIYLSIIQSAVVNPHIVQLAPQRMITIPWLTSPTEI